MTPLKMTSGDQIAKAVANYRALIEKHGKEFDAELVQIVLGQPEFADEVFAVFRRRVEAISNLIVRKVKVDRSRSLQQALDATGCVQHTDRRVIDGMPKAAADETEVVFFKPHLSERNGYISDDELEKEYALRGLEHADPISLAALNEADPSFAYYKPHCTHWKDAEGKWCYASFNRWNGKRKLGVDRGDGVWHAEWWFAGVRK